MKLTQITEMAAKKICPTCGHSMAGYHYWYKGGWKCKSSSMANAPTSSTPPAATSAVATATPPAPGTPPVAKPKPKVASAPPQKTTLEKWLAKHKIVNYTIGADGSVDVDGSVYLDEFHGTKIPVRFNKVTGDFECGGGSLTTLENSPMTVGGDFRVHHNELISLVGCPLNVDGTFDISGNSNLTSLEGINGLTVGGNFYAEKLANLTSLKGIYKLIKRIDGEVDFSKGAIKSNVLGLMIIKGVTKIDTGNTAADEFMNDELAGDGDPIAAQEKMIDAGFTALANP